jgi:hypothetical protein
VPKLYYSVRMRHQVEYMESSLVSLEPQQQALGDLYGVLRSSGDYELFFRCLVEETFFGTGMYVHAWEDFQYE